MQDLKFTRYILQNKNSFKFAKNYYSKYGTLRRYILKVVYYGIWASIQYKNINNLKELKSKTKIWKPITYTCELCIW